MDSMKKEEIAAIEKAAVFVKVFKEKKSQSKNLIKGFLKKKAL